MGNFSKLEAIQQHVEDAKFTDFGQSTQAIFDEIVSLNAWNAFVGKMVAEYEKEYRGVKELAYIDFANSKSKLSPSLAKDFIDARCGEVAYRYSYAERLNRTLVHYLDSLRSILSTLKQEMANIHYQSS